MAWALFCVLGVAGLLGWSYRRLVALQRLRSWAAPYLAYPRSAASGGAGRPSSSISPSELSEVTRELGWQLRHPSLVPRACAKASFSLGALAALMQAAGQLGSNGAHVGVAPLLAFASGCLGALGCAAIGRVADSRAAALRADWNALIRRSARDVAHVRPNNG